ncbi:ThiF family adenylyltransferase [Lysinibacillus sp. CNPSo 3705]|uniref:ThiF family adenylyltransferase n=1 Tax=Lysinibacillus sp. CNPSo 3705 TaxID=3028148 RepID=UPI002363C193|nr:ThiF family adenylyltransferase [Lysinibacillus sp. CNPSo 3705]MDD1505527.1 ThiF family adenylyltransferase [Lysinibacillus sp. CNPSo 3705]
MYNLLLNKTDYINKEYKSIYPYIVQIGTGGTGGYIVQHLSQMLGTLNCPHSYVLVDPDVIENKNLKNQLFLEEEIGEKKAEVLADRYAAAYNLNISTYTEKYVETVSEITSLFSNEYLDISNGQSSYYNVRLVPILIGCVDNVFTRQQLHKAFLKLPNCIYIDSGNESVTVPQDWQNRPVNEWSSEELIAYRESGWTGQIVCGIKMGKDIIQPSVCEVYPDILAVTDTIKPSEVSCSDLTASDPQRLIVNKMAAHAVMMYMSEILEDKCIENHKTVFHAKKGYMRTATFFC